MSKKLIYLILFMLVLSVAGNASAEIVVHWTFDEGSGTTVVDRTGNGYDGTFVGTIKWADGYHGGGVHFTAEGQIVLYSFDAPVEWPAGTVAVWVKADTVGQGNWNGVFSSYVPNSAGFQMDTDDGDPGNYRFQPGGIVFGAVTTEWVHLAVAWDGTSANTYYNGSLANSGTVTATNTTFNQFAMGINRNAANTLMGIFDDLRIYDHALMEDEIQEMMLSQGFGGLPLARRPSPEDGAMYEQTWVSLSWTPGDWAVSHDLYIGENFDDVNAGAESTFQGNQAGADLIVGFPGFAYPDGLVPGTTYYWRVDEVNDTEPNSPWKGAVWSFWIPPRTAYNPEPADGVKFVVPDVELSWMAGFGAKLHHVYFGDNFDDVNNAVVGLPQAEVTYTPGTLEFDKVYYWRADEFDGVATYKGDVWSFKTLPVIPITDPSLVGWWTLDEGMGTIVVDWSGHNNHGTLRGDPQWVSGYNGIALELDGSDDYVDFGNPPDLSAGMSARSMCGWGKTNTVAGGWRWIAAYGLAATSQAMFIGINGDDLFGGGYGDDIQQNDFWEVGVWHHICLTYDGTVAKLYADGIEVASGAKNWDLVLNRAHIGRQVNNAAEFWDGLVDDVRIYNKVLTQEEIQLAMRGAPLLAWGPKPTPGSTLYIRDATPLSWSPGDNASQHDIYFGTDRDAVSDTDASDTTGIYRGRQGVTIYTPPDVEWGGGPYYWRIDEYNTDATISKGNVWNFTITDFILIDDFEDYNDYPPDEIFSTWIDGYGIATNGSTAGYPDPNFDQGEHYVETTIVHGGGQSMPLFYENNFKYSEVTMTLVSARDWTEEGVGVLSLWFNGDATNAAERMYVALNGSAVVYHGNPDAALIEEWTEWTIDLQEFAAQGVNLANVNTISIGFGDKNNLQAGGSGVVFFDDIRLYRPAPPEPEPLPPEPAP